VHNILKLASPSRGEVEDNLSWAPQHLEGPAIAQKCEVHQNASFFKKSKSFSIEESLENVSQGPAVALDGPGNQYGVVDRSPVQG